MFLVSVGAIAKFPIPEILQEDHDVFIKLILWTVLTLATWPTSLSLLSYGSMLGIVCIINLIIIIMVDASWPSALHNWMNPMPTYLWPLDWFVFPKCLGLFMAGFSGIFNQ